MSKAGWFLWTMAICAIGFWLIAMRAEVLAAVVLYAGGYVEGLWKSK